MSDIATYLGKDHVHCDRLFADAENAVAEAAWGAADTAFLAFRAATLRHFAREEDVLFPAFEARTGMSGGPTQVMRMEHQQMRDTLDGMAEALRGRNGDGYLGLSETLLMLMRQHNIKEERILYPMADNALAVEGSDLVARMAALES